MSAERVVSGMRPTGPMHLGRYFGALKNWVELQHRYECYFFVADWHALTTHYESTDGIEENAFNLVVDWLAAGVNPSEAKIFLQSKVPEHAELHLLLSMITPLAWLERVPTYKDQQEKLREKDLATYGFLGYPLLQSADILIYQASYVPVGEDQVAHVELVREVARRFNHLYGKESGFEEKLARAIKNLGKKLAPKYKGYVKSYQEQGDESALSQGQALVDGHSSLKLVDKERLLGHLEGGGRSILKEPGSLLTPVAKMPGLDGQKMSASYGNTIALREPIDEVVKKINTMPTDPARVRRSDPGDPEKCPVWQFHKTLSDSETQDWVDKGCRTAGIGCLECKKPIVDSVVATLEPIQLRAKSFVSDRAQVESILADGAERARDIARDTMQDVRKAMNIDYS